MESFSAVREGSFRRCWGQIDGVPTRLANFPWKGRDARELAENLAAAMKRPVFFVFHGHRCIVRVSASGKDAFAVAVEEAPPLDESAPPRFTAKQGQYLAYIFSYTKIHRTAPAESDLQQYFRVSAPSVHEMIKTLERNGLIERTPRMARSIRILVRPEHLPALE